MTKFGLKLPLLCLITNPDIPDLVKTVEIALSAGVNMLQLRGHQLPAAQLYGLALELSPLCRRYGATFIVNDRVDVGLTVGADGFQLGTRSLPLAVVRQLVGEECLLGASVHSQEEARAAVADGADFLLAGTIFPSPSHPGEPSSGPSLLHAIKQIVPNCPLLAVGGITVANAGEAIEAGADGVAVISAILGAAHVLDAVGELRRRIGSHG